MKFLLYILAYTVISLNALAFADQMELDKSAPVYGTILADKVNIRAGCGLNFEILAQLNKFTEVVVIGEKYDWYKVKLPKEALCFVHKDYVKDGITMVNKLRVRAGAGSSSNILGMLKKGQQVNILEQDGDWLKIAPPVEASGWIKKDYLRPSERRFIPEKLKPVNSEKKKRIEVSGTIDELGKILDRQGTHKLIEGKKVLYYLKSKDIDLNLYVYQNVCVAGELIDLKNSPYPLIDVEQIK